MKETPRPSTASAAEGCDPFLSELRCIHPVSLPVNGGAQSHTAASEGASKPTLSLGLAHALIFS